MKKLAKIVPPDCYDSQHGVTLTHGTKVVLPDGSELGGITNIELTCSVNSVWKARIDCLIEPVIIPNAELVVRQTTGLPFSWWRRLLLWISGIDAVSMTTLESAELEWRTMRKRMHGVTKMVAADL